MDELWLPVFGIEGCGYEVSNLGRVRSFRESPEGRVLVPLLRRDGRLSVKLNLHEESKPRRHYSIHRIVAITFMCPIEGRDQINHIDGDPTNNRLDNLEWCTNTENQRHARETGLIDQHGPNSVLARFSAEQVRQIKRLRMNGATYARIREFYPMAKSTLSYILNGRTYRNVQ